MVLVVDLVLIPIGGVAFAYCILMFLWPGLAEDWAVWIVSWYANATPRSGDYRFAWSGLGYAIPFAIIFLVRIIAGLVFVVLRRS